MPESDNNNAWFSNSVATFGDRLSAARENAGIKQSQLAKVLGVKTNTIKAWEHDLSEPRANRIQMIAGVLNVSIRWLLTGDGSGVDAPNTTAHPSPTIKEISADATRVRQELLKLVTEIESIEKRLASVTLSSAQVTTNNKHP